MVSYQIHNKQATYTVIFMLLIMYYNICINLKSYINNKSWYLGDNKNCLTLVVKVESLK